MRVYELEAGAGADAGAAVALLTAAANVVCGAAARLSV